MNANFRLALVIAFFALIWMLTGLLRSEEGSVIETSDIAEPRQKVGYGASYARKYKPSVNIRAFTQANRMVELSAELDGAIESIPAKEGTFVSKGEVLCKIKDDDRKAIVEQAIAQQSRAKLDYEGALSLKSSGFQSASQIAAAKANLAIANAQLKNAQLALNRLNIVAPFSGVFEKQFVEKGAFMQRGQVCAQILDLDPILVVGQVSEAQRASLFLGSVALADIHSIGEKTGRISYISSSAQNSTKSYRIEIEIANADRSIISGLTANARVTLPEREAHLIPPSLLTLMDDEDIGLKVLGHGNVVELRSVSILGDGESGVWVSGLQKEERIITLGQEYVSVGEIVEPVNRELNSSMDGVLP